MRARPRFGVVSAALLLTLAGGACVGGAGSDTAAAPTAPETNVLTVSTGTEPTAPVAPAAGAALKLFVEAAGQGDVLQMWALLSGPMQKRFGGDSGTFGDRFAQEFEQGIGSFAGTDYQVALAQKPAPGWAVAAIVGERTEAGVKQTAAYAVALRLEKGYWRLEIGGPVKLTPVIPSTGVKAGTAPQLGMRVEAPAPITDASVWIDGNPLPALAAGPDASTLLVAGKPDSPLGPGTHVGIGFAHDGDQAIALAWPIRAE
jgi:hypothetical protein